MNTIRRLATAGLMAISAGVGLPVHVVLTTAGLGRALTTMPGLRFSTARDRGVRVLHVDSRVRYQTMIGFGAAMTDSSAWLLDNQLSPSASQRAMSSLFSPAGIGLNFTRLPIGGSDFTAGGQPYSYDDLRAGQTDPLLSQFSVAHDDAYIVPALRQMLSINPAVKLLATPWSPPPWMKRNHRFDDLRQRGAVRRRYYQPLAEYFVKFIEAYQRRGIPIWGITPENEPDAGSPFPASLLKARDEAAFVARNLAPSLAAAGLHPRIYGADNGADLPYARTLLASRAAADFSGLAWHCYGGEQAMSTLHRSNPRVPAIMTECSPGIIPYTGAEAAISGVRNWASVIALWNLALDQSGGPVQAPDAGCFSCTGLLTISQQTHEFRRTLNYYQLGQLSKFVAPGAVRIGSERPVSDFATRSGRYGVTPGLDDVAFLNPDGSKVLVAYNNSDRPIRFAVAWHGDSVTYTLAGRATVTLRWT